jgi:hypothetical protein
MHVLEKLSKGMAVEEKKTEGSKENRGAEQDDGEGDVVVVAKKQSENGEKESKRQEELAHEGILVSCE